MSHRLADVLRGIYGLENASEDALIALGAYGSFLVWEKDREIFSVGDPADGVFVLVSGAVDVIDQDGSIVASLEERTILGEISLMFGTPHTKSARTTQRTELLYIPKGPFDDYLDQNPDRAARLRELIETRLSEG